MSVSPVSRIDTAETGGDLAVHDGHLFVRNLSISPLTINPDGAVTVAGYAGMNKNAAGFEEGTFNGDGCNCQNLLGVRACAGIEYRVLVTTEWGENRELQSGCTAAERKDHFSERIQGPSSSGTYSVTVTLEGANTGVTDQQHEVIEVLGSGGGDECTLNSDCPGDEVCVGGTCQPPSGGGDPPPGNGGGDPGGGGGNTIFGYPQEQVLLVGGLVGAGALAFYLSDDDEPQYRAPRRRRR